MRHLLLALVWSALLYSCQEVTFKEAQPLKIAPLKEVPVNLQGTYQTIDQTTGEFSDTLIVESWGYRFKDKNGVDWLTRGSLSDTMVLKVYQNYYFLNYKTEGHWIVRIIQQEPSGALRFLSIDLRNEVKRKEILKKLRKKIPYKEAIVNGDTFYQINPTVDQLMALIKEGYFTGDKLNKIK